MNCIARELKKGKKQRINVGGSKLTLLPLNNKDVTLEVGDVVFYKEKLESIADVQHINYLDRYKINDKWVGKKKIDAKVKIPGNSMYVDFNHLKDNGAFVTCLPEVPDFTTKGNYKIIVSGGEEEKRQSIPLYSDKKKLEWLAALLRKGIDTRSQTIIGWNIKGLFSYVQHITGKKYNLPGRILDLKIMEAFSGVEGKCPQSYVEALDRISSLASVDNWKQMDTYYKNIAYPLISEVLPSIETTGLVHKDLKKKLYSHYEVEGQANGRLRCSNIFLNSYNPHTFAEVSRDSLSPSTTEDVLFLYLDYQHMEVSVLQWLSQDPQLEKIIDSGKDLYCGIWELLTTINCNDTYRKLCKSIFLPVVYGQGAASVAKRLKIPEKTADKFIHRIYKIFPVALRWIRTQQESLIDGCAKDYFGRLRRFTEQQYRVRNFVVQSPAATICLHKLIKLYESGEGTLAFHIHDGYGLVVRRKDLDKTMRNCVSVLEAEEKYYPGLKLKVSCQAGDGLNNLNKI